MERSSSAAGTERLVLLYLPQVYRLAKSLQTRLPFTMELEDLVGYGVLGLLEAIGRLNPERGASFGPYLECRIRGAMLDVIRRKKWLPCALPQTWWIFPKGSINARRCVQEIGCPQGEMQTILAHAVSHLPERHRKIIELYYEHGLSMPQIAQLFHIHPSRVSQLHTVAIKTAQRVCRLFLSTQHRESCNVAVLNNGKGMLVGSEACEACSLQGGLADFGMKMSPQLDTRQAEGRRRIAALQA
jgi:RNA polymerase sigma factor (sigma-70 family)